MTESPPNFSRLDPTDPDVITLRVGPATFRLSETQKHIEWDVGEGTTYIEFYSAFVEFCQQTS